MSYRLDRLKVLVVDDNLHMRLLLSTILQAFGVKTVYEAPNGEMALKGLAENPCDLIIVDWVMEGMSGLEFAEKVRTAPDCPNPCVPIIMLTGHTSAERVRAARDAGVNEFLAKPVSSNAIYGRLISVIEYPRAFVRTKFYFGPCRRRRRDSEYKGPERRLGETAGTETPDTASQDAA